MGNFAREEPSVWSQQHLPAPTTKTAEVLVNTETWLCSHVQSYFARVLYLENWKD